MMLRVLVCCVIATALSAADASAQYRQYQAPEATTVGEAYHLEFSFDFWNPSPTLQIASEALGIIGDRIDAVTDLGFAQTRFREIKLAFRPAKKHKLRFDFTPIKFTAETVLKRDIVWNGILYRAQLPVNSELSWRQLQFAYEWDFLYHPRWFVGVVLAAKYATVDVSLRSPLDAEYNNISAPIPSIGGIGRFYLAKNFAITGEYNYFKLPTSVDPKNRYDGRSADFNLYGTFNVTNNFGAQVGYRTYEIDYRVKNDIGNFALKGLYFGAVARY
jgi:hypothetical protein